jgi:hypothetical protein
MAIRLLVTYRVMWVSNKFEFGLYKGESLLTKNKPIPYSSCGKVK